MSDLIFTEQAAGATPSAGKRTLYYKTDGKLYTKNSAGVEVAFPVFTDLTAANTANVPAGNIAAVTVQAALNELDTEKATKGANGDISSLTAITSINGGQLAGLRNRIINGNFQINQRAVTGSVVLAAGAYGHDRFKAGAAGCSYTFATVGIVTTLTITAGSLVQVIEGLNVERTDFTMGWTGTAQGRILGGVYAASPVALTAAAGSNLSVEFGIGTLAKVQVEPGATVTPFEFRPIGMELALCQRYYEVLDAELIGYAAAGQNMGVKVPFKVTKRAAPLITQLSSGLNNFSNFNTAATTSGYGISQHGVTVYRTASATGSTQFSESLSASSEL